MLLLTINDLMKIIGFNVFKIKTHFHIKLRDLLSLIKFYFNDTIL